MANGFIFGGDTGVTAESLRRQREVAQQMLERAGQRQPRTIGDALANLGERIGGRLEERRAEREWKKQNEAAWGPIAQALAGGPPDMDPMTGDMIKGTPQMPGQEALLSAMGSGYLDPNQQAIAGSLLSRSFSQADQQAERAYQEQWRNQQWQREDQRRAEDRQWQLQNRAPQQRRIIQGPDGNPYYEDGSPVLPNVQPKAPNTDAVENDVREEFQKLPVVKNYNEARNGYQKVLAAANEDSAAGDVAMIFGFMKTIDPTSTVREGEFATVQNSGGISDQVRNAYNRVVSGERLNPRQRQEYSQAAFGQFKVYQDQYSQARDFYTNQVLGTRGNPGRALPPYNALTRPGTAPSGAPTMAQRLGAGSVGMPGAPDPAVDEALKKYGGQ